MQVFVNSVFNEVFAKYIQSMLIPNSDLFEPKAFMIYKKIDEPPTEDVFPFFKFVSSATLDVIDIINTKLYNKTFPYSDVLNEDVILNTLYSNNDTGIDAVLNYLQSKNVITINQNADIRSIDSGTKGADYSLFRCDFDSENNFYNFYFESDIELIKPYDSTNNPRGNKLFIMFPLMTNIEYGKGPVALGSTGKYSSLQKFYNPLLDENVLQASYIALEIGDINSKTADIKYDHIDKIEFINKISFKIRLPKTIK